MPAAGTRFMVIGVTAGQPNTRNPCLADQLGWAWLHGIPVQAYTMAGWPSEAEVRNFGAGGPWPPAGSANRLRNTGFAQARAALDALAAAGFRPPMVWIDVEPQPRRPWPTGTPARRAANRYLLEGIIRGFTDAGLATGLYSYPLAWRQITGGWQLPAVPVWATGGRAGRGAAERSCARRSFSAGPVLIAQWYDDVRDSDLSCRPFRLAPR